jgi:hypothetical protein
MESAPRFPEDAAARTSPFLDVLVGGTSWGNRFASFFNIGAQFGGFIAARVRISARLQMFPAEPNDEFEFDTIDEGSGFQAQRSDPPTLIWGGSLGYALASSENFVLAPGVLFMRTDEGAFGNFLGALIPFEWVNDSGIRIGFEVAVGRAFGGSVRGECFGGGFGGTPLCDVGEVRDFNRTAGSGFYSHFHMGMGFSRPKPVPREGI